MAYSGPVVDPDIHHSWVSPDDVRPYLEQGWAEYAWSPGHGRSLPLDAALTRHPGQWGTNKRLDTFPPGGGPPGSDYETMRRQLLDPLNIGLGVLSFDIGHQAGLTNPYFAAALCRAAVEWTLDTWCSQDDRLYAALLVAPELPEVAAEQIRQQGSDERVAEVLLVSNTLGKPFGHPVYHPIFEAATEMDLPVAIHAGGEMIGRGVQPMAGGISNSRFELGTQVGQPAMHHVASMITHGVFEKFPEVRVAMVEFGITWIPHLLWNLDARYDTLRRESPWVKRYPSEYVRDHVRFTTQPFDTGEGNQRQVSHLLQSYAGIEDLLCFATDYPHWDADEPNYLSSKLPSDWIEKLCFENPSQLYARARHRIGSPATSNVA